MGFPKPSEIKRALKNLEKAKGTLMLPQDASALDRFRWDLCQKFVKFKQTHDYSQKQMAKLLKVDEGKISKILHHRIEEFSTDRLIALYEKLDPNVKLKVG